MNFFDSRLPPNFWVKVMPEPNSGCWLWLAAVDWDEYRQFWDKEKKLQRRSHRFSYEAAKGVIQDGFKIDHLCRTRCCCNPAHLEAVTPKVNTLRGESIQAKNAKKTHCVHGHELTDENLLISKLPMRVCKVCHNARPHGPEKPGRKRTDQQKKRNKETRRRRLLLKASDISRIDAEPAVSDEADITAMKIA